MVNIFEANHGEQITPREGGFNSIWEQEQNLLSGFILPYIWHLWWQLLHKRCKTTIEPVMAYLIW